MIKENLGSMPKMSKNSKPSAPSRLVGAVDEIIDKWNNLTVQTVASLFKMRAESDDKRNILDERAPGVFVLSQPMRAYCIILYLAGSCRSMNAIEHNPQGWLKPWAQVIANALCEAKRGDLVGSLTVDELALVADMTNPDPDFDKVMYPVGMSLRKGDDLIYQIKALNAQSSNCTHTIQHTHRF